MAANLLKATWKSIDVHEIRLLLAERIGGPGQYDQKTTGPNVLHLPQAGKVSRIMLRFRDQEMRAIERGPAFDPAEWTRISNEVETLATDPLVIGREFSFCSKRVVGWWRGTKSGVQILPPAPDAPRAQVEAAEHPFIIEFPVRKSGLVPITSYRRIRDHRNLTLVLNLLLSGTTTLQLARPIHVWAVCGHDGLSDVRWVQQSFFAKLGRPVIDHLSQPTGAQMEEVDPTTYYDETGHDGGNLRVPRDLDDALVLYRDLPHARRAHFDRALFWLDLAARQWSMSVSGSFASLVSAVESLTVRGTTHRLHCPVCKSDSQHDAPGPTELFRAFFEEYAPGRALRARRTEMYKLRSSISHGTKLMMLDQARAFGWDPPGWNEYELHRELWSLVSVAFRNWLRSAH